MDINLDSTSCDSNGGAVCYDMVLHPISSGHGKSEQGVDLQNVNSGLVAYVKI